jgi:hypothetical protein
MAVHPLPAFHTPHLAARNSLCLDAALLTLAVAAPPHPAQCSPRNQRVAQQTCDAAITHRYQSRTPAVSLYDRSTPAACTSSARLDPANPSACVFSLAHHYQQSELSTNPPVTTPKRPIEKHTLHACRLSNHCMLSQPNVSVECGEIRARTHLSSTLELWCATLAQSCNAELDSLEREVVIYRPDVPCIYPTQPRLGRCHHCEAFWRRRLRGGSILVRCEPAYLRALSLWLRSAERISRVHSPRCASRYYDSMCRWVGEVGTEKKCDPFDLNSEILLFESRRFAGCCAQDAIKKPL